MTWRETDKTRVRGAMEQFREHATRLGFGYGLNYQTRRHLILRDPELEVDRMNIEQAVALADRHEMRDLTRVRSSRNGRNRAHVRRVLQHSTPQGYTYERLEELARGD